MMAGECVRVAVVRVGADVDERVGEPGDGV
jgi:hypothetical protein